MIRYFASKVRCSVPVPRSLTHRACALNSAAVPQMSQNLGGVPYERSWDGFVALSKELMKGRSSKEQRQAVAGVLDSLMPQVT